MKNIEEIKNKKIFIAHNTLSTGGAEVLLLDYINKLQKNNNKIYLYIMTEMGELISELPSNVNILNKHISKTSVLSKSGQIKLFFKVVKSQFCTGFLNLWAYNIHTLWNMIKKKKIYLDKLSWMSLSYKAPYINQKFDIAIAFTEGASTYYIADKIIADKKIAYIHTDYTHAGYTANLDKDTYDKINTIIAISNGVKKSFLNIHPECSKKIEVEIPNINKNNIHEKSIEKLSNNSPWYNINNETAKILSVSRLVQLKRYDLSIKAAKILKNCGYNFIWVALGEGEKHKSLQKLINKNNLKDNFILLGNVSNPYKYMSKCDIYVQNSEYEGKSVAIQEVLLFDCDVLISNAPGNKQFLSNNKCTECSLNEFDIANKLKVLIDNRNKK